MNAKDIIAEFDRQKASTATKGNTRLASASCAVLSANRLSFLVKATIGAAAATVILSVLVAFCL